MWLSHLHVVVFTLLWNARQDSKDRPFEVARQHVSKDGLLRLVRATLIITISAHFMELVQDLQDNTALLEEAEQQEFEGLLHKDQEEFEPLGLFFPSLRLLQKFEFLLIARL